VKITWNDGKRKIILREGEKEMLRKALKIARELSHQTSGESEEEVAEYLDIMCLRYCGEECDDDRPAQLGLPIIDEPTPVDPGLPKPATQEELEPF